MGLNCITMFSSIKCYVLPCQTNPQLSCQATSSEKSMYKIYNKRVIIGKECIEIALVLRQQQQYLKFSAYIQGSSKSINKVFSSAHLIFADFISCFDDLLPIFVDCPCHGFLLIIDAKILALKFKLLMFFVSSFHQSQ